MDISSMNFKPTYYYHWSDPFLYNFNLSTGYARLYMQPMRRNHNLGTFIKSSASHVCIATSTGKSVLNSCLVK